MPSVKKRRISTGVECTLDRQVSFSQKDDDEVSIPKHPEPRPARRSISGRRSTNFVTHISQIYNEGIQLGTKNKINQHNAWTVKLLDVMDKVLEVNVKDTAAEKGGEKEPNIIGTNFQIASNTLDTSVKIYSYRVDSVHSDTYRVLNGLNRSTKAPEASNEGEENNDENSDDPNQQQEKQNQEKKQKKKRVLTLSNTLDSVSNLSAKRVDLEFAVDPLFHKTAAAFDEGGAKGLLISQLGISEGCNIVFDSLEYHPEKIRLREELYSSQVFEDLIDSDWSKYLVCPDFTDFTFNWRPPGSRKSTTPLLPDISIDDEDSDDGEDYDFISQSSIFSSAEFTQNTPTTFSPTPTPDSPKAPVITDSQLEMLIENASDIEIQQDLNESNSLIDLGGCYPSPEEDLENNQNSQNTITSSLMSVSQNDEEDFITKICTAGGGAPTVDYLKMVLDDSDEYKYFNNKLLQNWAGPEHWKFKPLPNRPLTQNGIGDPIQKGKSVRKPRGKKKEFFVNFMEDDQTDYDKVFKMWEKKDEGRISKKSLLDSPEPTTLPFVDIHYDLKSLTQLFCKPGKSISFRKVDAKIFEENPDYLPEPIPLDLLLPGAAESSQLLPDNIPLSMGDTLDDDDDDDGVPLNESDWNNQPFSFDSQVSQDQSFSQVCEALIDEPEKVKLIKITHAKRAKRVDIEKLRGCIWKELCTPSTEKRNKSRPSVVPEDISEPKLFSNILSQLPEVVPQPHLVDLSVPLCFICLLDLANKKGLQIDQKGSDLAVSKYVRN